MKPNISPISEEDYILRHGYSHHDYSSLKDKHPHISMTYFPTKKKWLAVLRQENCRPIGEFHHDKMACLIKAIEILNKQ